MRFSPRKTETDPIVAMLDSGEYDSPAALARAIVVSCYGSLLERDWYVTLQQTDAGLVWGYGLSATPAQAEKLALYGGPGRVVNVSSAARKLREMEKEG